MVDFTGKKLLIMGANPETAEIVKIANAMGIYTIVTDYIPNSPAKSVASKSYDIDCLDVQALVSLAKEEEVDGVLVGVADVLLPYYQQVCEILELPCYCTREQITILSNKDLFKRTCKKYGILGIPEYHLSPNPTDNELKEIIYPVLVKPVDNCSGKGMTVCYNESELKPALKKGLSYSRAGKVLIERFMTCDDFIIYYTFKDGYYSVSMLGDRYTCTTQKGVSPVCLADVYPSKYSDLYFRTMHEKACRMFHDLGISDGVFLIQAFIENDDIYVYDPGFRLQGGAQHLVINAVHGFDQRKMLIEFALTGSMGPVDLRIDDDYQLRGKTAGSIWFLLKEGVISKIMGIESLHDDSRIVNVLQRFTIGDEILPEMIGTEQQVFARIHVVCNSREEYVNIVNELEESIHVISETGDDMIVPGVDVSVFMNNEMWTN